MPGQARVAVPPSATLASLQRNRFRSLDNGIAGCQLPLQHPTDTDEPSLDTLPAPEEELSNEDRFSAKDEHISGQDRCTGSADRRMSASCWVARSSLLLEQLRPAAAAFASCPRPPSQLLGNTRLLFPHANLATKAKAAEEASRETNSPGPRQAVGDPSAAQTASPGEIPEGIGEEQGGEGPELGEGGHQEASKCSRTDIHVDESLRQLPDRGVDWDARFGEVLWSCELPPDGWSKLRQELQPASALPSAHSFLYGGAGVSGSHSAAQGGQDRRSAAAPAGDAANAPSKLGLHLEGAMQRLLEQGGLSFMDEMLLVNVLRLPPLALDDMRTALSPVYPDRRGQGAQGDNVWVSVKPAGTPSAEAAAALLKQLSVAQPSNPFGATGVARSRWPRLTNCRLFPAWGYLDKEALQSPSAQLVYRHALRGLALMESGGVSLPWALEPGWCSTGEPPLDPVRMAAASMLHAALEACQSDLSQGGQDEHPRLPPPAVLYWAVAKVPPDTMQQLLRVLGREPQEACPASPGGHRRQQQQQQQKEEAAVPEPLSPAHLEMVAQAVVQHPMGVIAAVTEAMMREVGQQAKDTCALALKQLEQTVLAFVVAACCLATWRTQGGPAPAPAPAPAGPPTPPRSPQAPHQQHAKQQPQQQRLLRQRTGGGSSGAGAADQDDALFDCVRSTPWAGPETLRRLQLAVRAMAEYGWLEEPYGCTAADQQGLQPEQLEAIAHRSMTGVVGSTTGAELVLLSARIRADSALGSAGMQQALTVTEEGRLPELAAFREARSAALCVRGAPLSGCQLRGVVEALRPGLLAAHPGTWGAAVRRAEEREQRGEQEEDRLMVLLRAAVACLASSAQRTRGVHMGWLQLAPCALVGLLWAAQDPPAVPEALTQLTYQHLARHAVTDYARDLFACVPSNLCDAIVRLLPGCAASFKATPTELPTAPGAAGVEATAAAQTSPPAPSPSEHLVPAATRPPAPAAALPSRQQQHLVDMYDTYLRFLLYDMTCVVETVLYSQQCLGARAPQDTVDYMLGDLAAVVAAQRQVHQARGTGQHSPVLHTAPPPPPGTPQPLPEDTWQLLTRAQAAGVRQQAVVDALGLWPSDMSLDKPGRAGAVKRDQVQGTICSQVILDPAGLQLGREVDPGVAGQVVSGLLLARDVGGSRNRMATQVVARGGEAVLLLAVALHHGAKGLRDLVFAPQLLLPHEGNQEPLSSQRVYGCPRTDACDGPGRSQQQQQVRLTSEQQEQRELEALVADCAVRMDMRLGARFVWSRDVAAQYPPEAELGRHTVEVSAQCSWGAVLGALREPFLGRSRTHVAWLRGVGLVGLVRSIMLLAQLRKELGAEGREVHAGVTGVGYEPVLAAMVAPGSRRGPRKLREAVQQQADCEPHFSLVKAFRDAAGALQAALAELRATEPGGGPRYEPVLYGMGGGGSGGAVRRAGLRGAGRGTRLWVRWACCCAG